MRQNRLHLTNFFSKEIFLLLSIVLPFWKKIALLREKKSVFFYLPILTTHFSHFSFYQILWKDEQNKKDMKGRMVCIHLLAKRAALKELASAMFKPLWLYEQSEMLGLDWQAMLVWMAAGQSYPCLLLYAHCVYCKRAAATTQHCEVLHCELILPNILAILCYPLGYNLPLLCTLRRA